MTVLFTPLNDAQKESLLKIKRDFTKIATKKPTPSIFAEFQKALGKLDRFVKKENLALIRIENDGTMTAVHPAFYPWRHENPRGYRDLQCHADYYDLSLPHFIKGDYGHFFATVERINQEQANDRN